MARQHKRHRDHDSHDRHGRNDHHSDQNDHHGTPADPPPKPAHTDAPAPSLWSSWETVEPATRDPDASPAPSTNAPAPAAMTQTADSADAFHAAAIISNSARIAAESVTTGHSPNAQPQFAQPDHQPNQLETADKYTVKFDKGLDSFNHVWGDVKHGTTAGGDGYIELTSPAATHESASAMIAPTGPNAGFGYGEFSFTLSTGSDTVGPYALGWPGTDKWPGPEIDAFEIGGSPGETFGKPYSTAHKNDHGNDAYRFSLMPDGIDPKEVHTYGFDWRPDSLSYFVDGHAYNTITDPEFIPKSFADGGENLAPGVGVLTSHWSDINTQDNTMRLYEFSHVKYVPDHL